MNLKKDEKLEVQWQDGTVSTYPIALLRKMCPCATCKEIRAAEENRPVNRLRVLPGDHSAPSRPLAVTNAELVGGYALKLEWTDGHDTGIYSFQYLREIAPERK